MSKSKYLWILLISVSLFLRIYHYRTTPGFLGPDEIQYLSEASALVHSGHDITGKWTPWSLSSSDTWYAELPSLLLTPAVFFFQSDSMLAAHLTHIVIGTLFPFVLALFAYGLFKNTRISILVALLASINPWLFQFSRLSFESYFSLSLFFSGFSLLLLRRRWSKLQCLLPLTLGFFQYQGHKPLLLPFVILIAVYLWFHTKTSKKPAVLAPIVITVFLISALTLWFIVRLPSLPTYSRASAQFTFLHTDNLSSVVDSQRKLTLTNPFTVLFSNKLAVFISQSIAKYFASLDTKYLFLSDFYGPDSWAVTNWGKLYLLDIPLILLGIVYLVRHRFRMEAVLLAVLIVVSPIPDTFIVGSTWPVFRSVFIIPFLLILAALGLQYLYESRSNKKLFSLFITTYLIATVPFFYTYFYTYPIQSKSDVYFYTRVVANYIQRIPDNSQVLILADEPKHFFETLVFYNNWLDLYSYPEISKAINSAKYTFRNITVSDTCFNPEDVANYAIVLVQSRKSLCPNSVIPPELSASRLEIASIVDSGSIFQVYNDSMCQNQKLPPYSHITGEMQLNTEQQNLTDFCQSYFVKYPK